MTIDDLKIDELEHFAEIFREVDLQLIRNAESEQALWYINAMLNTSTCQTRLVAFRFAKIWSAIKSGMATIIQGVSDIFSRMAKGLRDE